MYSRIHNLLLCSFILYSVPAVVKCQTKLDPSFTTFSPNCGGSLTGSRGQFNSPNYPNNYNNNDDCIWVITAPSGLRLGLYFESGFDTESPSDYVVVRDGPNSDSNLLLYLTGQIQNPGYTITTGNTLWVWFHSDHSVTRRGFSASFYDAVQVTSVLPIETTLAETTPAEMTPIVTTENPGITPGPPGPYCSKDIYNDYGHFTSPYYPSNYPNLAICILRIHVTYGNQILITFNGPLQLESCCDDLFILDGPKPGSALLAHYTGTMPDPPSVLSTGRDVWILFQSDGSVDDVGFNATFYSVNGTTPYEGNAAGDISALRGESTVVRNPIPIRPTAANFAGGRDKSQINALTIMLALYTIILL